MQDLIDRLRQIHHTFNLPFNRAQLAYLKNVLQASDWPDFNAPANPVWDDLIAVFRDHNGMPISNDNSPFPRMMSFEEMLAFQSSVSHIIGDDKCLLWDAGDSNYYGIYLREPLMARVFYLNHDGMQLSLMFRGVRRMYESLLEWAERRLSGGTDNNPLWWHWKGAVHFAHNVNIDYPKTTPDPEHDEADLAAAQVYLDRYLGEKNRDKRRAYAEVVMYLLPVNVREPLEIFLDDAQDSIQSTAIQMFALRRDEAAIPKIEALIRSQKIRGSGINALAQINTPAAINALVGIARDIDQIAPDSSSSLLETLKRLGYETMREGNRFSYRKSGTDDWTHFGQV